jgi:hypothetical protein
MSEEGKKLCLTPQNEQYLWHAESKEEVPDEDC